MHHQYIIFNSTNTLITVTAYFYFKLPLDCVMYINNVDSSSWLSLISAILLFLNLGNGSEVTITLIYQCFISFNSTCCNTEYMLTWNVIIIMIFLNCLVNNSIKNYLAEISPSPPGKIIPPLSGLLPPENQKFTNPPL